MKKNHTFILFIYLFFFKSSGNLVLHSKAYLDKAVSALEKSLAATIIIQV